MILCSITEQSMLSYILTVKTLLNKCSYGDNCTSKRMKAYLMTGILILDDGPGSGMYRFLGRCNPQVARLWVNRLPSWIPQVGCCVSDSSVGTLQLARGYFM